jgi:lipopolysaccharide export system protein LptC
MTWRRALGALAILAIVAGTWWLRARFAGDDAEPLVDASQLPDYYLEGFSLRVTSPAGDLRYLLAADRMEHFLQSDTAEITRPRMILYENLEPTWQAIAERGWMPPGRQSVHLQGEVVLASLDDEGEPLHIVTRDLVLQPDRRTARTTRPVTATADAYVVNAGGMQIDLEQRRLSLFSGVTGVYAGIEDHVAR